METTITELQLIDLASSITWVPREAILSKSRKQPIVDARRLAIHLLWTEANLSKSQIASVFQMTYASVYHHIMAHDALMVYDKEYQRFVELAHKIIKRTA